jgi:hypothetical protein
MPLTRDDPQYAPTIPTQVPEPFHRDGWVYEEKVDGWRTPLRRGGPQTPVDNGWVKART